MWKRVEELKQEYEKTLTKYNILCGRNGAGKTELALSVKNSDYKGGECKWYRKILDREYNDGKHLIFNKEAHTGKTLVFDDFCCGIHYTTCDLLVAKIIELLQDIDCRAIFIVYNAEMIHAFHKYFADKEGNTVYNAKNGEPPLSVVRLQPHNKNREMVHFDFEKLTYFMHYFENNLQII